MKVISLRILTLIAHWDGLSSIYCDIGNAFIQADTKEKIYTRCGSKIGSREDCVALIVRAIYGLCISAERFITLSTGFFFAIFRIFPPRYDRDTWMRMRVNADGYDYICTHVDDFNIVAKYPDHWINLIEDVFSKTKQTTGILLG